MPEVRENRLFLGNPGTGKSTLINCLVGEQKFKSGISWGGGLTQDYQRVESDGIAYMDTPGLADVTIIKQAAEAVTKALKESGSYKIFFMVRLQNGRVVSEDLATVERVLDSIDLPDLKYSIVINHIGTRQYETLKQRGDEYKSVVELVNSRKYRTSAFCLVPKIPELEEASCKLVKLPADVENFIETVAPVICIRANNVKPIDLKDFEEQTQAIRNEMEALRKKQMEMVKEMERQQERYQKQLEQERARHEKEMEDLRKQANEVHINVDELGGYPADGAGTAPEPPRGVYVAQPATPVAPKKKDACEIFVGMAACVFLFGPFGICIYFICCDEDSDC